MTASNWPHLRLEEVAEVAAGNPAPQDVTDFCEDGEPFVRMQDVGKKHRTSCLSVAVDKVSTEAIARHRLRLFPAGSVLVPKSGASVNLNHRAMLGRDAYVVSHLAVLVPNCERVIPEYLYAWSQSYDPRHQAQTTSLPSLPLSLIKAAKIPVPPITKQRRIVDILSRAEGIVRLRRDAEKKTAELIPALFLDMFGDPASNPKGWAKAKLGDLIHAANDGPHVSPTYSTNGIPFLSARHIKPGKIVFDDLKFISIDEAERQWRKCKPTRGDVLYTKGGTTGIAAMVNFDQDVAVWVHVALLKTNHALVEPLWLECMLNSAYCYKQSQELTHGIANRDLGLKRMINIDMYLPKREFQNVFAQRASAVNSIITQQSAAAAKAQATFDALLAQVFSNNQGS